ncbi:MAG: putative metalloenzyme YecM, partial [Aureispira sp.]
MADNSEESLDLQEWQSKVQQSEENTTGLPDALKVNLESKYGMSLDHIKVHYNASKPAKLEAHAYAKFPNIYIAPG